ncbi:MAG: peroxiredoxin [Polyangiaceae bacterium]|jgi:peroxiredoxin Q/BCP
MTRPLPLLLLLAACSPAATSPDPAAPSAVAVAVAPAPVPTPAPTPTPTPTPAADPLIGQPAPDFTATAQDGSTVHIAALTGKPVVVYFYPKDETPGCTKEACSFRDAWAPLAKTGAVLVGVSADSLDSHKAFVAHWKLPFLLITDADGSIGKKYGVPFESYHQRQTIVIGADGKVRKVYRKVDVSKHAQEILADLSPTSPTSAN